MSRILKIQHWKPEFEYNDTAFFAGRRDETRNLLFFAGEEAPDPRLFDLVIVYGGYMSAYDDAGNPWISAELHFLEDCLKAGTPIFGICLGSQLLARLLGARVYPCPAPEFGFRRISLSALGLSDPLLGPLGEDDGGFLSIEWHDDAWDLPPGAESLASSDAWPNQAFRYGRDVLAIQFHLEFTQAHMAWAVARPGESESADPSREDRSAFVAPSPRYDEIAKSMFRVLTGFLDRPEARGLSPSQGAVAASRVAR